MKRLLVAIAVLLATPALAQQSNKAWGECVANQLRTKDLTDGSPAWVGVGISSVCKDLYQGVPGTDAEALVKMLEKYRATGTEPFTIGPSQSLPPVDKKM